MLRRRWCWRYQPYPGVPWRINFDGIHTFVSFKTLFHSKAFRDSRRKKKKKSNEIASNKQPFNRVTNTWTFKGFSRSTMPMAMVSSSGQRSVTSFQLPIEWEVVIKVIYINMYSENIIDAVVVCSLYLVRDVRLICPGKVLLSTWLSHQQTRRADGIDPDVYYKLSNTRKSITK
jgi:hypothetical protein